MLPAGFLRSCPTQLPAGLRGFQELTRLEKTVERDGVPFVVVQALYKGTLTYLTLDCPRLKLKIDVLPFENNSLQRLV
ncbi:MAG TPA: hypothetical protein VF646_03660 [Cytophagales bacterium]|jgi:hypothetical protein